MIPPIFNVEELKTVLEWACEVHCQVVRPKAQDSRACLLGFLIPSEVWFSDDPDNRETFTNEDRDDMWFIFDNWFKGLSMRENIIITHRYGIRRKKLGFKTIGWILRDEYKIFNGTGRTTISDDHQKALLKIYANMKECPQKTAEICHFDV